MPRPKIHDDALRTRLLDDAGRLLSTEGPAALSVRRLANDAGTSTTAVYSLFGGKPALLRALYVEAFRRFGARLAAVAPTGDPADDLVALGLAYRDSALADPHLYGIMFSRPVAGFEPDEGARAESAATMDPLLGAVRAGIAAGRLRAVPAEHIALSLWGCVHGLVSLELGGCLLPGFDVALAYRAALVATVRGWQA